ncbi:MAG TPA: hypothetical protein VFT24_02260 [Vicinamibacterales bacterium]|nr:hypothetical protein [Vicinamibacterales bacterium]
MPTRRALLRALSLLPLMPAARPSPLAQRPDTFQAGWNHPWIGYGHDFGRAWGHDGLSTSGWTCETGPATQGFTESRVLVNSEAGRGALRIQADLAAGHPARSRGAVSLSLVDHWPFACPPPAANLSVNLDGVLIRIRLRLPRGSAGSAQAPNWLQLFLKTRLSAERWPTMYAAPVRINPSWEERSVEIVIPVDTRQAVQIDDGFDPRKVGLVGLTMGMESGAVAGPIWIDEIIMETSPPIAFDFTRTEIDAQFAFARELARSDWSLVRFFIFGDGRAAPSFDGAGRVDGLDDAFYRDFDMLVETAEKQRISLIPVLLDYGWCAKPRQVSGVQLGGHADVIRAPVKRQSFLERALRPLLERYVDHPAIHAWEICNEPEWIVSEIPEAFRQDYDLVALDEMRSFVRGCAEYIHRVTRTHLATLGSARRKWVTVWNGCGLDLYQFHWFNDFRHDEPFPWLPCDELRLDKPCLVGEVPTRGTRITRERFLAAAQQGGYSGLLFWSYGASDAASNLCSFTNVRPR